MGSEVAFPWARQGDRGPRVGPGRQIDRNVEFYSVQCERWWGRCITGVKWRPPMCIHAKCLTAQLIRSTGSKHGCAVAIITRKRPTAASKHRRPCLPFSTAWHVSALGLNNSNSEMGYWASEGSRPPLPFGSGH